jgi:MoxR-vWA-beta-propeller ternary system domain bpX4
MSLGDFLEALASTGRVELRPDELPSSGPPATLEVVRALEALDARARLHAPGVPPSLDLGVAVWAAEQLYHACILLARRELGPDQVASSLGRPSPAAGDAASQAWSADLTLRRLPDLLALARGVAPGDPLVEVLRERALAWPLSSVGVAGVAPPASPALSAVLSHPSLRQLYVDRVIARRDLTRLRGHPPTRLAAREALGAHPDLAPEVARVCQEPVCSTSGESEP